MIINESPIKSVLSPCTKICLSLLQLWLHFSNLVVDGDFTYSGLESVAMYASLLDYYPAVDLQLWSRFLSAPDLQESPNSIGLRR